MLVVVILYIRPIFLPCKDFILFACSVQELWSYRVVLLNCDTVDTAAAITVTFDRFVHSELLVPTCKI
jgi:hypothetical protein